MSTLWYLLGLGGLSLNAANDISRGSFAIQKVRTTFAGAHGILTAAAYLRAGMMRSHQNGRHFSLRGLYNSEDASILARILGVTQEVCNRIRRKYLYAHGLSQTINHRRLIREVYDDRTLHRMLGVEPRKTTVPAQVLDSKRKINFQSEPSRNRRTQSKPAARAVEEIFEEADMDMDSDIEEQEKLERHHKRRDHSDDEKGRYGIAARDPPPNKQRKLEKVQDTHAVFTTDDEEEEEGEVMNTNTDEDSLEEYESDGAEMVQGSKLVRQEMRRSYWLSKGIGNGADDDSS